MQTKKPIFTTAAKAHLKPCIFFLIVIIFLNNTTKYGIIFPVKIGNFWINIISWPKQKREKQWYHRHKWQNWRCL